MTGGTASAGPPPASRWRHLWVAGAVVTGAVVLGWLLAASPPLLALTAAPVTYACLGVALLLGELRPVPISRGDDAAEQLTTSTTFAVALLAVGPASIAILLQAIAVLVDDLARRRSPVQVLYNVAQYSVSLFAARVVFATLSGAPVAAGPVPFTPDLVGPALAAGLVFALVNHVLVAVVVALHAGRPIGRVVAEDGRFSLITSGALVALAPLAAFLVESSPLMLALLCAPILAVHRSAAEAMQRRAQALRDPLTGLANRELLKKRTGRLLAEHRAHGPSLLLVDLDHFKDVNDTLGHPVGDALLVHLAHRLTDTAGADGTVARLGGDEFAVLVPGGRLEAERMAARLLDVLRRPAEVGELRLLVQASIGVAVAPEHGRDVSTLFKHADTALYDAKEHRARFSFYRPEADVNSLDRLALLADLKPALEEGQLQVVFQPQLRLATGRISGVEALVRWDHPTRGVVMPDQFIPLAENAGLIGQITGFVLDQGIAAVAGLRRAGHDLHLAVNISARHMSDLALPDLVSSALVAHRVPASRLTLEVTETAILSDPARVDVVVDRLREAGVAIAVDDYGTGHASLSYLKRLRIDELKIDKSFVVDMLSDPGDAIIVASTVQLGKALGLRIVAEGVEDAHTLERLRVLGCDLAQGWHIGRPVPAADLPLRLLAEGDHDEDHAEHHRATSARLHVVGLD